ncbi:MAG TPA: hypothetical protein VFW05_00690 [Verrucomicrobiae bacterium]|nr:hypothetical protein [Verrucomicrobiae bacterium]
MELLLKIAVGLMALGLGFTVIDFFLAKLLFKMYPDPNCWDEALSSPDLSPEQRSSLEQRQRLYQNGISHRFRKWGITLLLFGVLLFATVGIIHVSR